MGLLVAIEGIDGSGKGTQAALLAERARDAGLAVATFSFPRYGVGAFSALIADYLNGELGTVRPELPALLYAGDRLSAKDELLQALAEHDVVVLDRYVASNLAHQGANAEPERRAEVVSWIAELEYGLYALPKPDLTVLLDLPPEVGLARARGRAAADRIESESLDFHQRVRQTFRALAEAEPDRYLIVDAQQSPDAIAAAVRVRVAELLSGLPLQQLSRAQQQPSGTPADGQGHRPHAQTGPTPQLHP